MGLLLLAYGIGTGPNMLKTLAIEVIGALTLSVMQSLIVTPTVYDFVAIPCLKPVDVCGNYSISATDFTCTHSSCPKAKSSSAAARFVSRATKIDSPT